MPERIDPKTAHQHMEDNNALLVCAYDDAEKFEKNHLEGAISLDAFRAQETQLGKDHELIFY